MSQAANYALPVHSHFQEPDKTHTPEVKGTRCVLFWTTQVWGMWRYNPFQIRSCHLFNYQFLISFCGVFFFFFFSSKFTLNSESRKLHGKALHISFAVCDVRVSKAQPSLHRHGLAGLFSPSSAALPCWECSPTATSSRLQCLRIPDEISNCPTNKWPSMSISAAPPLTETVSFCTK